MKNRSFCNQARPMPATSPRSRRFLSGLLWVLSIAAPLASAGDAPQWMHAALNAPLPAHDERTEAILVYSERIVTVESADRIRMVVREAYKIMRPEGREYGTVVVPFNSMQKVDKLHGWCIPAQGRDYEVKDKDGAEVSLPKVAGSELISDVKAKFLVIPAPDPGNTIGIEYETTEHPMVLQDVWQFQGHSPAQESHYLLQLPPGWEYRALWVNHSELKPTQSGNNQWQWTLNDVGGIRYEEDMPPVRGVAGQMVVTFFPVGGPAANSFASWRDMGVWYRNLTSTQLAASPEIKQQVATLSATATTPLAKIKALADFVQQDIRYVGIELGIGGWQPHPAADIFAHRYGDCKDKATLLAAMLHEIGIDSYYVVINSRRGVVSAATPAHVGGFDHAIIAIKLPEGLSDPSLVATMDHPKLGKILFFDPTNDLTPFGQIGGYLQANYGLLVMADGGELVQLPQEPPAMNGIERTAKLTLDASGTLRGDVEEVRLGDRARNERRALREVKTETDRIKPIERVLAGSISNFRITKAALVNPTIPDRPFGFRYSFEAPNYAKNGGGLLLVRPRVIGSKSLAVMETKESRKYPVEFVGPVHDTDSFEITVPSGYEVDDMPPPVDSDFGFASYHSKTEVSAGVIHYSRTFEVKELSVPAGKAEDLKKFYRIIASDERNAVVLKPSAK
jgi:hypothetical protein